MALVILHDLQCISQLDSEALRVYVQFKKWPCELVSLHDFYFFPFAPSLKSIQVIRCLLSVPWRVSKKTPAPKSVWLHWLQTGDTTKASWQIQGKWEKEATQRFRVCTRKCDKNMVHLKRKWERRTELTTICVLCNVCGVANVVGWLLCNPSTTPPFTHLDPKKYIHDMDCAALGKFPQLLLYFKIVLCFLQKSCQVPWKGKRLSPQGQGPHPSQCQANATPMPRGEFRSAMTPTDNHWSASIHERFPGLVIVMSPTQTNSWRYVTMQRPKRLEVLRNFMQPSWGYCWDFVEK